jgi:hypothetical protein
MISYTMMPNYMLSTLYIGIYEYMSLIDTNLIDHYNQCPIRTNCMFISIQY